MTERYCRNCGHELAETDRFCPNCGTPVHEAAHVPTTEANVDVPSPPQQAGATIPPPDEAGREGFPVAFFTVVAAIGGSVSAALLWSAEESATDNYIDPSLWPLLLAFAIFLGALLPGVFGFAFGFSVRGLRPLPAHLAGLAIGTFVFGMICLFTVKKFVTYGPIAAALELRPETVFIPAIAALITPMFYMSSAYIGRAWRRQKAGEPSRTSTSVREDSDQPQTPRQQATVRHSGETWTPRQQAIVGLIGTITAALIGLFGVLVQVLLSD